MFAIQLLPDWQIAIRTDGKVNQVPFVQILNELRNDARRPVCVCFPWKPATEKIPADVAEHMSWRRQNGKPALAFVTPATILCALTLIARLYASEGVLGRNQSPGRAKS